MFKIEHISGNNVTEKSFDPNIFIKNAVGYNIPSLERGINTGFIYLWFKSSSLNFREPSDNCSEYPKYKPSS